MILEGTVMKDSKDLKAETKFVDESPSSKDLTKTLPKEALKDFLLGKRHLLLQDYSSAVRSLSTACEMYTQHFGELASECGEVHFLYGKALFFLCQQKGDLLGFTSHIGTENGEENPEDTEAEFDGNQEKEPSESTESPQHVQKTSKEANEKENEAPVASENEVNSSEEQQEAGDADLSLAWDSLEKAKFIYQRQCKNSEAQLKVVEILQLLAEISLERIEDEAAITDLKTCLEIRKRYLKPDDRRLARTCLRLGLAQIYDLKRMLTESLDNFRTAVKILESQMESLKSTPDINVPDSFDRTDTEHFEDLELVLSYIREETRELTEDAETAIEYSKRITINRNVMEKIGFPVAENMNKPVSDSAYLLSGMLKASCLLLFLLLLIVIFIAWHKPCFNQMNISFSLCHITFR